MTFLRMKEAAPSNDATAERAKALTATRAFNDRVPLAPPELEVIEAFIHFARVTGIPRSTAEIFGLLFVSSQPIPNDEVVSRLNLSVGAASKGLRQLKEMGAIRSVYVAGDRRDHYAVETGNGVALAFFRAQIRNYAANGAERLKRLSYLVQTDEARSFSGIDFLRERVKVLMDWHGEITKLAEVESDADEVSDLGTPMTSQQRSDPATRFYGSEPNLPERIRAGDSYPDP
jgi:DNA-binding transcriptional regulator GbsR (MarR family)